MARRNTLNLQVLGGVACEFENFSSQVFENGSQVDASFGTDARLLARDGSKVALYATAWELLQRNHVSASFVCTGCEYVHAGCSWADDA